MEKTWSTVKDLAEYLSIPRSSVYEMVTMRRIPYHKMGRLLRFKRSEVDLWLEKKLIKPL